MKVCVKDICCSKKSRAEQLKNMIEKYQRKLTSSSTCKSQKQIAKCHFEINKYKHKLEKLKLEN